MTITLLGFALWGLIVGLVVGFTSIGIGLLGVPGLIFFFDIPPVTAVGSMAVAGFIMMISGTVQHYRRGNVLVPVGVLFSVTAIPASYVTATFAGEIGQILPLETIIGTVIIVSVVLLFYRYIIMRARPRQLSLERWKLAVSPFIGVVLGALMGATSISGSIIIISFIMLLKLPSPNAVGTTSAVVALSLLVASIAHLQQGNVDPLVLAGLIPGVFVGAAIGAHHVDRVPRQALRIVILVILLAAGIMIFVG